MFLAISAWFHSEYFVQITFAKSPTQIVQIKFDIGEDLPCEFANLLRSCYFEVNQGRSNMRQLASIQKIEKLEPIEGADAIEKATILGWSVVVKKGEFKEGDLCVYCEIDSVMPDRPEFEFLRDKKFRIKTMRLRNTLSQGIAFPMSILGISGLNSIIDDILDYPTIHDPIGTDVTKMLGVTKYEIPDTINMGGDTKGNFPNFIAKTDETRIQSVKSVLDELHGLGYYISQKVDGSSSTYFFHPEDGYGACSRRLEVGEGSSVFWKMGVKYDIARKLKEYSEKHNQYLTIQGEVAGPGIQGNKLGLKEHELFVFNVFDIKEGRYLDFDSMMWVCEVLDLTTVPIIEVGEHFDYSLDDLLKIADDGKYPSGKQQEGIVIRPTVEMHSNRLHGRLSFKVISNKFLLKNDQ
jgi:RNA ligase (TIGR02306 family)